MWGHLFRSSSARLAPQTLAARVGYANTGGRRVSAHRAFSLCYCLVQNEPPRHRTQSQLIFLHFCLRITNVRSKFSAHTTCARASSWPVFFIACCFFFRPPFLLPHTTRWRYLDAHYARKGCANVRDDF